MGSLEGDGAGLGLTLIPRLLMADGRRFRLPPGSW